jgi:hypothetical protein
MRKRRLKKRIVRRMRKRIVKRMWEDREGG